MPNLTVNEHEQSKISELMQNVVNSYNQSTSLADFSESVLNLGVFISFCIKYKLGEDNFGCDDIGRFVKQNQSIIEQNICGDPAVSFANVDMSSIFNISSLNDDVAALTGNALYNGFSFILYSMQMFPEISSSAQILPEKFTKTEDDDVVLVGGKLDLLGLTITQKYLLERLSEQLSNFFNNVNYSEKRSNDYSGMYEALIPSSSTQFMQAYAGYLGKIQGFLLALDRNGCKADQVRMFVNELQCFIDAGFGDNSKLSQEIKQTLVDLKSFFSEDVLTFRDLLGFVSSLESSVIAYKKQIQNNYSCDIDDACNETLSIIHKCRGNLERDINSSCNKETANNVLKELKNNIQATTDKYKDKISAAYISTIHTDSLIDKFINLINDFFSFNWFKSKSDVSCSVKVCSNKNNSFFNLNRLSDVIVVQKADVSG